MNRSLLCYVLLLGAFFSTLAPAQNSAWDQREAAKLFTLDGTCKGGTFGIYVRNRYGVILSTSQGETAAQITEKLLQSSDGKIVYYPAGSATLYAQNSGMIPASSCGTDTGLIAPLPPYFLTGTLTPGTHSLRLEWEYPHSNQPQGGIRLSGVSHASNIWNIDPTVTRLDYPAHPWTFSSDFEMDQNTLQLKHSLQYVINYFEANGTPSNVGIINLNYCTMEEKYVFPFTNNIIHNWAEWKLKDGGVKLLEGKKIFEPRFGDFADPGIVNHKDKIVKGEPWSVEARKKGEIFYNYRLPSNKPLYQSLSLNSSQKSMGGIYRKFLGLTPGHTYRIHARLNTFEGTPDLKDWAFTMHTCANAPGNNQLTTEQFKGDAPLPNGSSGKQAGLIAEYGTAKAVTNSQWEHFSTAKPQCPDCIGDITLPEGADTITTWLRLEGQADLEVGFDWIKLEDLTCMTENGITPSTD